MTRGEEARRRGRPAVSSRAQIEAVAMRLFAEHGYGATTIPMIAEASGVGRTTVFRYWRSKSDIVWAEFDRHIERLSRLLDAETAAEESTLTVVRKMVVANLGLSIEESEVWLARFALVDQSDELRSEEARHWADWAAVIAAFVARRHGHEPSGFVAQSIAGAIQGAFLGVLRSRPAEPDNTAAVLLPILDRSLSSLTGVLQPWVDSDPLYGGDI